MPPLSCSVFLSPTLSRIGFGLLTRWSNPVGARSFFTVGLYFGILFAITAVNMVAIALFVAVERRREEKAMPNKSTLAM